MACNPTSPFASSWVMFRILIILACHAQARHIRRSSSGDIASNWSWDSREAEEGDIQWQRSRALSADQIYANAQIKGCRNLEILWGKRDVGSSVFTNVDDLKYNGWIDDRSNRRVFPYDFKPVFEQLGLSSKDEDNPEYLATHTRAGTYSGVAFSDVEGKYWNSMNVQDGVIISIANFSPDYYADLKKAMHPQDERPLLPPLHKFSDVVALQWQNASTTHSQGSQKLQWWFRKQIVDSTTLSIMRTLLWGYHRREPPEWPGIELDIASDEGTALLGSPNGNGIAYMLAQHISMLGGRYLVEKVHFFSTRPPNLGYPGHQIPTWRHLAFKIVPKVDGMKAIMCPVYGDEEASHDADNADGAESSVYDAGVGDTSGTDMIDAADADGGACRGRRSFWRVLFTWLVCSGSVDDTS